MHVDRLITAVADSQRGVVTREQLAALGLGRGAVRWRIERGLLHPIHYGVYLWGHASPTTTARVLAAVLACGEGAVLTHLAAAAQWGMRVEPNGPIDVTVIGRRVRHPGIRTHTTASLDVRDITTLNAIPITSPARTLLDCGPELTTRDLVVAIEQAQVKRLVHKRDLEATLQRTPRHPGAPALRALLAEPAFTRSEAERRVVALLRAAKLPAPAFNAKVEGYEVDALWRAERLILEFDSYAFHATRAAFERDRRRDADLSRAGYRSLRTTWLELTRQSHALIARIAKALAFAKARRLAA